MLTLLSPSRTRCSNNIATAGPFPAPGGTSCRAAGPSSGRGPGAQSWRRAPAPATHTLTPKCINFHPTRQLQEQSHPTLPLPSPQPTRMRHEKRRTAQQAGHAWAPARGPRPGARPRTLAVTEATVCTASARTMAPAVRRLPSSAPGSRAGRSGGPGPARPARRGAGRGGGGEGGPGGGGGGGRGRQWRTGAGTGAWLRARGLLRVSPGNHGEVPPPTPSPHGEAPPPAFLSTEGSLAPPPPQEGAPWHELGGLCYMFRFFRLSTRV